MFVMWKINTYARTHMPTNTRLSFPNATADALVLIMCVCMCRCVRVCMRLCPPDVRTFCQYSTRDVCGPLFGRTKSQLSTLPVSE